MDDYIYGNAADGSEYYVTHMGYMSEGKFLNRNEANLLAEGVEGELETGILEEIKDDIRETDIDASDIPSIETHFQIRDIPSRDHPSRLKEMIKELKAPKKTIDITTGTKKVAQHAKQYDALKAGYEISKRAHDAIIAEGKRLGKEMSQKRIDKLKKAQEDLKQKQRDFRKALAERKKINDMIKRIGKAFQAVGAMPAEYAAPIVALQKKIDLKKLSDKKLNELQDIKNRLEGEFGAQMELDEGIIDDLGRLDKVAFRDLTFEEMENVHDAILHYLKLAKDAKRVWVGNKQMQYEDAKNQFLTDMRPRKVIENELAKVRGDSEKSRKAFKHIAGLYQLAPDTLAEMIAGPLSIIYKTLYNDVDAGWSAQKRYIQQTYDNFLRGIGEDFWDRHQISNAADWMNDEIATLTLEYKYFAGSTPTTATKRVPFTRGERMSLYRHMLNPGNRRHVLEGGIGFKKLENPNQAYKIDPDQVVEILEEMTPAELEFAGDPVTDLFIEQGNRMAELYVRQNWSPLRLEHPYFPADVMPFHIKGKAQTLAESEGMERLKGKSARPTIGKNMLKRRVKSKAPIYLNSIESEMLHSIDQAGAYLGLEVPLSTASRLLYDPDIRSEMQARYDPEVWKVFEKGLKDIAGQHKLNETLGNVLPTLRGNFAKAVLALNPFVIVKQPLSYMMYSEHVDYEYMAETLALLADKKEFAAAEERHKFWSPKYRERREGAHNRDLGEIMTKEQMKSARRLIGSAERRALGVFKTTLSNTEWMMGGIKMFDNGAVVPGMEAAVKMVTEGFRTGRLSNKAQRGLSTIIGEEFTMDYIKDMSPEEKTKLAYRFADLATDQSQPQFTPQHRSHLSRDSELWKGLTMFSSFTNRAGNMLARQTSRLVREGKDMPLADKFNPKKNKAAKKWYETLIHLLLIQPLLIMAINALRDSALERENDTPWIRRYLETVTGYHLIGRDIGSPFGAGLPLLELMDAGSESLSKISKLFASWNAVDSLKLLDVVLEGAGILRGWPYRPVKQSAKIVGKALPDSAEEKKRKQRKKKRKQRREMREQKKKEREKRLKAKKKGGK
jgi:hypothetical protein